MADEFLKRISVEAHKSIAVFRELLIVAEALRGS